MELIGTCLNLPQRMERELIASPFYAHPYGGIARDIAVTKEGFARFFEWSLAEVDFAMMVVQGNGGKVIDTFDEWAESLGYIVESDGKRTYMITIINRDHSRVSQLLKAAPYLWQEKGAVDPIIWGDYDGPPELY